jgi:transposase
MAKKILSKEDTLRNRVYSFAELHPRWSKSAIVKHFMLENIPRSTIYNILHRKENKIGSNRKVGSGRLAIKFNKTNIKRLKKTLDHSHGISQRMLAMMFGCHHSHVCKTIQRKTNIKYRKKGPIPGRTPEQKLAVRPKCSRLARLFRKKKVVIDDESYFYLSNFDISGNSGFYSSDVNQTPEDIKLKRKLKFEPKLMVWAAMSPDGISKPYIVPSGQAINQDVYIEKCLRDRLLPFIQAHHKNDEIVFWPDLASSHYAKKTLDFLNSNKISFAPRSDNPANSPELRPIEDFWSELKRRVYAKCWKAENLTQLENRIRYCYKQIHEERIHRLGAASFTRVDKVRREGLMNP